MGRVSLSSQLHNTTRIHGLHISRDYWECYVDIMVCVLVIIVGNSYNNIILILLYLLVNGCFWTHSMISTPVLVKCMFIVVVFIPLLLFIIFMHGHPF